MKKLTMYNREVYRVLNKDKDFSVMYPYQQDKKVQVLQTTTV